MTLVLWKFCKEFVAFLKNSADLRETDKSQEWVQAVEKTHDKEGAQKAKKLYHSAIKCPIKVTQKQMWFDILAAGSPPEKINQQPNTVLVSLHNTLKPKQQVRTSTICPNNP